MESRAFCLIGGDISGIQNYIFDVLTQQGKVAKRLRARSLFVQLVSEVASHKILHAFNLPLCNLIISAGGNFYILVPNVKESTNFIEKIQKEFDEWTLNELNTELSISLACIELAGEDLKDFSNVLAALKNQLNYRKYQLCGENPDLKFSTGVILSKPHDPLSFCVKKVEEKLKMSKHQEGKDKITLFNQTVGWDAVNKILSEAKRVIEWLEKKPPLISRGFAYNLLQYGQMDQKYKETKETKMD